MNQSTQHAFNPEEIMAYLDGELEARQTAALASHLEHCVECQSVAAQLRRVSQRLLEFQIEPCPKKLSDGIVESPLATSSAERKPSRRFVRGLVWALASVLILGILGWLATPNLMRSRFTLKQLREYQRTHPREQLSFVYQPPQKGATVDNARVGGPPAIIHSNGLQTLSTPGAAADSNGNFHGLGDHAQSSVDGQPATDRAEGVIGGAPGGTEGKSDEGQKAQGIEAPEIRGPMIVQTASITILAPNYDQANSQLQPLTASHGGYVQDMTADTRTGTARSVSATLRVPDKQLENFLGDLRKLGHVEQETRNNQEVTDAYIDLNARLKTARATEQRILQLLGNRTGKLSDVLEAEQELARIRGEIESMDGERAHMEHQVRYATVQVQLNEEYRVQLNPESFSTGRRLRNSLVEGLGNLAGGITGAAIFAFAYGPSILFWLALFGVPAWFIWRRLKRAKSN
jgi:Domain of unknown function (DUF4349)/Putative zinc-finger